MKRLYSLLLVVILFSNFIIAGFATNNSHIIAADKLYFLGLFNGTGTTSNGEPIYSLNNIATRYEAITMLIRLLGKQNEALNGNWITPFTDVVEWAKPYVGYAYANGLTSGTSSSTFGGNATITSSQYLTFVLRALGYSSNDDFKWNSAWELSDKLGLTFGEYSNNPIASRGDLAQISLNSLSINLKNSNKSLSEKLINEGIYTQTQYDYVVSGEYANLMRDHHIEPFKYSFVRINNKLYEIVYSYERKRPQTSLIYYEPSNPSNVYIDSLISNDMWNNTVTLSLLTHTYKTTTSDNPFLDGAIDMFSTYYDSATINIEFQKHYLNTTSSYFTYHHSYRGKVLDIPINLSENPQYLLTTINDIKYCGQYIDISDYCDFFALDVSLKVEFDTELNQNILVVNY